MLLAAAAAAAVKMVSLAVGEVRADPGAAALAAVAAPPEARTLMAGLVAWAIGAAAEPGILPGMEPG
jgi:hypothetical protein